MPSSFTQGKEALVDMGVDSFKVARVPVVDASLNRNVDSLVLHLEGEVLKGSGTRSYRGYFMTFLNDLEKRKDGSLTQRRLEADVLKGSNKCSSKIEEVINLKDHGSVKYEVSIPDYIFHDDSTIYINLNLEKLLSDMKLKPERKYPFEFDYTFTYERFFSLTVPEGYEVLDLPDNLQFNREDMSASISYREAEGEVIYELKIAVNELMIQPDRFEDFNDLIKSLSSAYSNTISLKKI